MPGALTVPTILQDGLGRTEEGAAWLARLPDLVAGARARWDLRVGDPFTSGASAWCAPVTRADGTDAVLKLGFPHDEACDEAAALRAWHGHGTPLLLAHDADDWALLLERLVPGTALGDAGLPAADALRAGAEVLAALWRAPGAAALDVPSLVDVCAGWADLLEERAERARDLADPGLVRSAAATLRTAAAGDVVLHGDLNPGNVLRDGAGAWRAVDPKPVRGTPAYDLWPLLAQVDDPFEHDDPAAVLAPRARDVAAALGLDARDVLAWGAARAVESALWVWDRLRDPDGARAELDRAGVWARLAG